MKRRLTIRVVAAIVVTIFVVGTWIKSRQFDLGWLKFYSIAVLVATVAFTVWDL
jgi:hypothetical protein